MESAARRRASKARNAPKSVLVLIFLATAILLILVYIATFHFRPCHFQNISIHSSESDIPRDLSQKTSIDFVGANVSLRLLQNTESGIQVAPILSSTLVLYELYYADNGWSSLHDSEPYQPLCVNPNMTRPNSTDIDAPAHLPVLMDATYQGLICEYGAIFAVRKRLPQFQKGANWVGFQSWRAAEKKRALSPKALESMVADMRRRDESGHTDVMYFWSEFGPKSMLDVCDGYHGHCSKVYSVVFHALFADIGSPIHRAKNISDLRTLPKYIPVVPGGENERHAVMSYWAMHTTQFRRYVAFARMFAAGLEGVFDLHGDINRCPLTFFDQPRYQSRLCWCFILERVVNMWAKHAGIRMLLVDIVSGDIKEIPALPRKHRWSVWFGSEHLEEMERRFEERLSPDTLQFYHSLG